MRELSVPKISKWPFYVADAVLLALAVFIFWQATGPLNAEQMAAVVACVMVGAAFGAWPFILDYRAATRLAETEALTSVVAQVQNIEIVGKRISDATAQWVSVTDSAEKTNAAAKKIAQIMTSEAKEFAEFIAKANDTEKSTLRIEAEKLRRTEGESLQVIVRMFDHIFALQAGALRSGNPKLAEQITQFSVACREAARRIGLVPFLASPDEPFDPQRHQTSDGKAPAADAVIADAIGVGYTYQGQLLRPAVVQIREVVVEPAKPEEPAEETNELPLNEF